MYVWGWERQSEFRQPLGMRSLHTQGMIPLSGCYGCLEITGRCGLERHWRSQRVSRESVDLKKKKGVTDGSLGGNKT